MYLIIHASYHNPTKVHEFLNLKRPNLERIGKIKYSKFSAFLHWVCKGFHSHKDFWQKWKDKDSFRRVILLKTEKNDKIKFSFFSTQNWVKF